MNLGELQDRLAAQYASLHQLRATEKYPVYAIEHGLRADEHAHAKTLLRQELTLMGSPSRKNWLVWIAAAAEVGYGYDGTEYWDSFSAEFPRWHDSQSARNQIRIWFQRFQEVYGGLPPSGPWARHFPIIAWPITQAILPRYLQRHFADHLFEVSSELVRGGELTLDEIGDFLCNRYYGHSSRFQGFLQQKALTARIVMALRTEDMAGAVAPIEASTLDRIVADFDRLGRFGQRLREARHVLRDAKFVNSHRDGFIARPKNEQATSQAAALEQLRLIARRIDEEVWSLSISLPDLASALRKASLTIHDLEKTGMRYRIVGTGGPWMPARALFSLVGQTEEPIFEPNSTTASILEFDREAKEVELALNHLCTFRAEPIKVLKVRTDGFAFEIVSKAVRAGQAYVLAIAGTPDPSAIASLELRKLETKATSISLWLLEVPKKVSETQIAALKSMMLGYVLTARVEPIGLCPRWNPRSGALTVLSSERAMFAIESDVAVKEFLVGVDDLPPTRLKPVTGVTLIDLGQLSLGLHRVSVTALGTATGNDLTAEELLVEVAEPAPWKQAISGKAGVAFATVPRHASIEEVLSGSARIHVLAPPKRTLRFDARFFAADGQMFDEKLLGRYATPLSEATLLEFPQKLTSGSLLEKLERATRIDLVISLDEFGSDAIRFEKAAEPLRWLRLDDATLRLADDTGGETQPEVEYFELGSADIGRSVAFEQASKGISLSGKGALLVATYGGHHYHVVATALQKSISDFSGLGLPANVSNKEESALQLLGALRKWSGARRLLGPMAFIARQNAVLAIESRLEALLCGEEWARKTAECRRGDLEATELYKSVFYSLGFPSQLRTQTWQYGTNQAACEAEFVRLAAQVYNVCGDAALCRLALRLAFAPSSIDELHLPQPDVLDILKRSPSVLKGAYFARLTTELRLRSAVNSEAA